MNVLSNCCSEKIILIQDRYIQDDYCGIEKSYYGCCQCEKGLTADTDTTGLMSKCCNKELVLLEFIDLGATQIDCRWCCSNCEAPQ